MKISKEAKVGILAVVTLAMLYFGFNYLKGSDIFSRSNKYVVVYDNIDGLTVSNPVQINGLSVGRVDRIDILQQQNNKLLVTLDVDKRIEVRRGSKAVLMDAGVLGGKMIVLQITPTGELLEKGDTLVSGKEGGLTGLLQEKALPVLSSVDSLAINLNRVIKQFDQTGLVLNKTLEGAQATTGVLQLTIGENRENIRRLMANLGNLSASLAETEKEIKPLLAKAGTVADSLNALKLGQTMAAVNQSIGTLQQMLADINGGKGTLGKLKSDEALYRNVNEVTVSLNKLLVDFREHPKRYVHFSVFGKKDKPATTSSAESTTLVVPVSDSTNQK